MNIFFKYSFGIVFAVLPLNAQASIPHDTMAAVVEKEVYSPTIVIPKKIYTAKKTKTLKLRDCVCNGGGSHTSSGGRAGGLIGGGVGAAIGGRAGGDFGAGVGGTAGVNIGNEIGHHMNEASRGVMQDRVNKGGKHWAPSDKY